VGRRAHVRVSPAGRRYNRAVTRDPSSEHELIRRARDGEEAAFADLVMLHADRVYGALRRFGLDASEADEVSLEVFVRAWRGLPRFEERAQFSTWLYRIAFNEAQRGLARRLPRGAEPEPNRDDVITSLPESPHLGPEAQTLDREFEQTLERALEQLPVDWRAAVVLRDIESLSTQQAAEIVGVGEAAFKSRLHRGRMRLRALLEPYLQLEEDELG
jgi:RNA polymerase sigma-70 factor, ECF subfamily